MPTNINTKSKKGFTIIEVVLVLAVAGLIFLMVFIALPALQRSQRDTQRRNDYGMLSAAITSYSASNGGKLYRLAQASSRTEQKCEYLNPQTYINAEGEDPDGYIYQLVACTWAGWEQFAGQDSDLAQPINTGSPAGVGANNPFGASLDAAGDVIGSQVYIVVGADCENLVGDHTAPKYNPSSRAFAIYGFLESGSQTYCNASQ